MTPQLQQAIKLLQLSRLELQETLSQELESNPMLEEGTAFSDNGAVKTLWLMLMASKVREPYAVTHDFTEEVDQAKQNGFSLVWQGPGVETKEFINRGE